MDTTIRKRLLALFGLGWQRPDIGSTPRLAALLAILVIALGDHGAAAQGPRAPGGVRIESAWSVQPAVTTLQTGESQQFFAFVPPEVTSAITWTASAGVVTAHGLYTAPVAAGNQVITATAAAGVVVAKAYVQVIPPHGATTAAADRFADSVGVNIHLHYDRTLYRDNFPLVKSRLLELGVRHVRDGMIDTSWTGYFDRHNELGLAGIKGVFIIGPTTSSAVMEAYPSRMANAFEAYEALNEADLSGKADWVSTEHDSLARLRAVKSTAARAGFPIYGPSLTKEVSYSALGDVSASYDQTNVHDYLAGRHPGTGGWGNNGYGSIAWNLALLKKYSAGKPIVATETGYWNSPSGVDAVPESVAGKYMPRLLLEQFRLGIARTYIYELADQSAQTYGLLTASGEPKPAFLAVKNLVQLLSDPGPAVTVVPLRYSVSNASADVRHMAFQKRDGSYFVAVWIERSGYDLTTRQLLSTPPQTITVAMEGAERLTKTYAWQADGSVAVTAAVASGSTTPVTVTDRVLVLEFRR